MFCIECGQPIEEITEYLKDGTGQVVAVHKHYIHTTADTYPWLNEHKPRPGG